MTTAPPGSSTAPRLHDVLSGQHGAEALGRIAVDPLGNGARDPLTERLPLDRVVSVELMRTKYKPGRKLTGYYRVHDRTSEPARPIAVTWYPDERVGVLVSPEDAALPQLARLSDRARLAPLLGHVSGRSPGHASELVVQPVRYRPGQRHVLHVVGGRLGPDGVYAKVDRDDSGARAVPVATELGAHFVASCPGARLVQPVGYAAAERVAVWEGTPGVPLWHRLRDGRAEGIRLIYLVGRALRVLHEADARVGRTHSVPAETAATLRAGEHLTALLPREGDRYRHLVSAVVETLDRWPVEPATLVHGDVKCDNLLAVGDRQVTFLDLDRVALAEPALDLGKFLADLRWWCPAARLRGLRRALRAGYGACDPARWARADLLAVLFSAKLAARRCEVHDPAWTSQVETRLSGAADALEVARAAR